MEHSCAMCGELNIRIIKSKKFGKFLCTGCYTNHYHKVGLDVHSLPKYGEISYDSSGKPICHICGRAFKKLLSHVWQKHKVYAKEYKTLFGLGKKGILWEDTLTKHRKNVDIHFDLVVKENLVVKGKNTRFKKENSK